MVAAYETQEFEMTTLNLDELKQEALDDLEEQLEKEKREFEEAQERKRQAKEQNAVLGGVRNHIARHLDEGITVTEFAKMLADKNLRGIIGNMAMSDILPAPTPAGRAPRGSKSASADEVSAACQEALTTVKAKKGNWVPVSIIRGLVSVQKLSDMQRSAKLYAWLEGQQGVEAQGTRADKAFIFNG